MALAIERALRRPPNSAPRTAPAPEMSSLAWRVRVSVSSSSTRRCACASALSSRSRFASSRSRIFAASASARSCAATSQRFAKSSADSPGRETSFRARLRCSSSGRRSTRWLLDVLRRLREELRLGDRRLGEDEDGAVGRRGGEVAVVVVDLGLAREVEPAVERPVDGLELLLLVDVRGAVVVAERDPRREEGA